MWRSAAAFLASDGADPQDNRRDDETRDHPEAEFPPFQKAELDDEVGKGEARDKGRQQVQPALIGVAFPDEQSGYTACGEDSTDGEQAKLVESLDHLRFTLLKQVLCEFIDREGRNGIQELGGISEHFNPQGRGCIEQDKGGKNWQEEDRQVPDCDHGYVFQCPVDGFWREICVLGVLGTPRQRGSKMKSGAEKRIQCESAARQSLSGAFWPCVGRWRLGGK